MENNVPTSVSKTIENTQISDLSTPIIVKPENSSKSRKVIVFIVLLLVVVSVGVFLTYRNLNKNEVLEKAKISIVDDGANEQVKADEPMAFYDLTVPYLRERDYESALGELEILSENFEYTSFLTSYESDGYKINGLLTRPTGTMPDGGWPAVIFIHGYIPPTQYATTEKYVEYVNFLARNGLVVFKIDLRGHGNSEGEPGGGYYGSDYVVDAINASMALSGSNFVNPEKIGYWGHSMAGNTVMRVMAARPETPAGVIWAGAVYTYVDMQKYSISDSSYQPPVNNVVRQQKRREMFEKYGTPSAQSEFWIQVAPTSYLSDMKGAVEIHHAVDDNVVDIGYSRDLDMLLDEAGVEHALHEYSSGGHNINGGSFTTAMQRSVDFYKKYLK